MEVISLFSSQSNLTNKLPFIIGVSGHRDIKHLDIPGKEASLDGVKDEIKKALKYWIERLGGNTPIWLLSGMAEGADLLAIDAAEELIKNEKSLTSDSIKIIPCLPMQKESYEMDFQATNGAKVSGLEKFKELFERYAKNHIVIANSLNVDDYERAMSNSDGGVLRSSLYLNLGAFIAKYSNVLIAVWDGYEGSGVGGTHDVVFFTAGRKISWPENTENEVLKQLSDFDGQQGGVIHHIPVKRKNKSQGSNCLKQLLPFEETSESEHKLYICAKNDISDEAKKYNCDDWNESSLQKFLQKEFQILIQQITENNLSLNYWERVFFKQKYYLKDIFQTIKRKIFFRSKQEKKATNKSEFESSLYDAQSIFSRADKNAIVYQYMYRWITSIFFFSAFIGLVLYEYLSSYIGTNTGVTLNKVIILSIIICVASIKLSKKKKLKTKYQLYRSVAEAMRIRGFLNLGSVPPESKPILPRRYRQRFPVINHAISVVEIGWWKHSPLANLKKVKENWIDSQLEFLENRLQVDNKNNWLGRESIFKKTKLAASLLTTSAQYAFICSVLSGIGLLVIQYLHLNNYLFISIPYSVAESSLMLIVQLTLVLAGALALWKELANYETTVVGYEDLYLLYQRAHLLLQVDSGDKTKRMLMELAREAIQEHAEWNHNEDKSDLSNR
ncbi:hypothetical protein [Thalassotalea sp. G2M2-11]|uniref:hypothetical protein n=1 Tax=Thalassotalea sp. G2M2-11 TaxID=2787627 RepID=UPI0019D0318B|nr:hypothetical protein [Thalassotalea sp. G2M2-11]